ncbi:VOC family protein [Actinoplanes sp. NPDC049265]|uniref:VOC family protein n=1 Tax=Actinoplanes sp. NPDC049265 TaxID=3363902 RepID=UPI00371AEF39
MSLIIHNTLLPANDPDESLTFWRDALGFEVRNEVGYGGMRWITLGSSDQPDMSVVLYPPKSNTGVTDTERKTIAELMAKGSYATIVLATSDVDKTFDRIQATGAEVVQEPTDQPYGIRDCAFRDPSGTMVRINQTPV